ncbi:MAG: tetratricopeptide repeat protein [Gemmatimonadaceae bacterium]|nr:tetratricopeptide repeat protein [Gemmatimonadaceae bacterium]
MAQHPRSSTSAVGLSDDPVENLSAWLQHNQKTILTVVGVVAVSAAVIFGYRWMSEGKRGEANRALYEATGPMQQGKLPEAQAALEKVVSKFGGTASGAQASMLLAQVLFDQKKYQEGITALEKSKGSAGSDFAASFEALMATGYEELGKFDQAAEHYGKAAAAAKYPLDKGAHLAAQARDLTTAGKLAEARKIWEELAKDESLPFAQEAQVRIGELAGAGK